MAEGEDAASLRATLAEKEQQLQQAALFGQQLYEQLKQCKVELEQAKESVESRDTELVQAHERISELEAQQQSGAGGGEAMNPSARAEADLLPMSRSKEDLMESQLKEATSANRDLMQALAEKEEEVGRLSNIEREYTELKHASNGDLEKLDECTLELEAEKTKNKELQASIHQFEIKLASEQKRREELESQLETTREEFAEKQGPSKVLAEQLRSELMEAHQRLQEQESALEEARFTKRKLEEAVAAMARETQRLHRERDEYVQFLDEARATISSLRQDKESAELDEGLSIVEEVGPENSLLGELEKEVESRIVSASAITEDRGQAESAAEMMAAPADAKNCAEYFYLAATAVKIGLAIKNPRTSDGVFRINLKALYDQALAADVPFHEWYSWLEVHLEKKMESLTASVTTDAEDPINYIDSEFSSAPPQELPPQAGVPQRRGCAPS